jgi:hypothetical protein
MCKSRHGNQCEQRGNGRNQRPGEEEAGNVAAQVHGYCFTASGSPPNPNVWILDSGATSCITWDKSRFFSYEPKDGTQGIECPDGTRHAIVGKGDIQIQAKQSGGVKELKFEGVLHVPTFKHQLILEIKAVKKGLEVWKKGNMCLVKSGKTVVLEAKLDEKNKQLFVIETVGHSMVSKENDLWHQRLAHASEKYLDKLKSKGLAVEKDCVDCAVSKATKQTVPKEHQHVTTRKLELVHSDIMGLFDPPTPSGKRYVMTFIDDYSKYARLELLASKAEAPEAFIRMEKEACNQNGLKIGTVHTDNGGEYTSNKFKEYLATQGITQEKTAPYVPSHNGVSERKNRTGKNSTRALLSHAGAPAKLWEKQW